MTGNSKTGRALYTGHARLWQGDSVLEAESIELLKNERDDERGRKRAGGVSAGGRECDRDGRRETLRRRSQPVLWHAQSAR